MSCSCSPWESPARPCVDMMRCAYVRMRLRVRELRENVNKEIETLRAGGQVGSSLQAEIVLQVTAADHSILSSLGEDLKFVFITSAIELRASNSLNIGVAASLKAKCERCWHYRSDVGADPAYASICARCTSNLYGAGEQRRFA